MIKVETEPVWGHERALLQNMVTQHAPELMVEQMSGSMVAHDVPATIGVHQDLRPGADARPALGDPSAVHNQPGQWNVHISHLDAPRVTRVRATLDLTGIAHLPAGLHIKGCRRQDHLDLRARLCHLYRLALHRYRQHACLQGQTAVRVVVHALPGQEAAGHQGLHQVRVTALLSRVNRADRTGATREPVRLGSRLEPHTVHGIAPFLRHIACDLQGQPIGGIEIKGRRSLDNGSITGCQFVQDLIQIGQGGIQRALETFLLGSYGPQDMPVALTQLIEKETHLLDDNLGDLPQEGPGEAESLAKAGRTANDHAQHIAPANVARHGAIGNQKSGRSRVISNHPVRDQILPPLLVALTKQLLCARHEASKEVGVIVGSRVLQDRHQALKTHPRIDMFRRERVQHTVGVTLVLNEHEIPQLDEPLAGSIDLADVIRHLPQVTEARPPVQVDFAARAAGARVTHLPEVVLAPVIEDVVGNDVGQQPTLGGFGVAAEVALIILKDGGVEMLLGQAPPLSEQFPPPLDGFLLVIIAKGPIAQHLKKSMMIG